MRGRKPACRQVVAYLSCAGRQVGGSCARMTTTLGLNVTLSCGVCAKVSNERSLPREASIRLQLPSCPLEGGPGDAWQGAVPVNYFITIKQEKMVEPHSYTQQPNRRTDEDSNDFLSDDEALNSSVDKRKTALAGASCTAPV